MLGYAVPRLDPMTYQVVFKAVSVLATALLAKLLLGRAVGAARWLALVLLLVGAALCVEPPTDAPMDPPTDGPMDPPTHGPFHGGARARG